MDKNIDKYTKKILQEINQDEVSDDFTDKIMKNIVTEKQSSLKITSLNITRFFVFFLLAFLPLIAIAIYTNDSNYDIHKYFSFLENINFNFISFSKVLSENAFIQILPVTIGVLIILDFVFSRRSRDFRLN